MKKLLILLALPVLALAQADVAFVCDDSGGSSDFPTIAPAIIDAMDPAPSYEVVTGNGDSGTYTSDPDWWDDYLAVVWYASGSGGYGRNTTTAERDAANGFIEAGGWLLVTGYDVLGSPTDTLMAEIVRSSTSGDGPFQSGVAITDEDHFIVNGPYGAFTGGYSVSQTDHDRYTPNTGEGCVEVIEMDNTTNAKIIDCEVDDGHVTGWNGNRSTDDWSSYADMANMVRNWLDTAAGEPDVTPPEVTDMDPGDGDVDVPIDSDIVFHCTDDISGVDTDTIDFTVQDTTLGGNRALSAGAALSVHHSPARTLPGDLDIDDTDPLDVVCTWTGYDPFYMDETITCTVSGDLADNRGNQMGDDFVWTFDTELGVEDSSWGEIKSRF
ncbi:Ig-like domain-containing protein [bacterium]|nr:Ig-like domain-containing protein [bacterium]